MENRKITLMLVSLIAPVLHSVGFNFIVSQNTYNQIVKTTTYLLKNGLSIT